jgi:hypothetical protein
MSSQFLEMSLLCGQGEQGPPRAESRGDHGTVSAIRLTPRID